jgi:hypothetical protein
MFEIDILRLILNTIQCIHVLKRHKYPITVYNFYVFMYQLNI